MLSNTRITRRTALSAAVGGAVGLVGLAAGTSAPSPAFAQTARSKAPTVVLVHGAWADASGWTGVIERLDRIGYNSIATANPLRSLDGDAAYLASVLDSIDTPIILVGHSYGGMVMTNAAAGKQDKVKALIYVAAFAPDTGEDAFHSVGEGSLAGDALEFRKFPPGGENDVDTYIKLDKFHEVFCADLPPTMASVMARTQRPAALAAGFSPTKAVAWKDIPSWYLVATEDKTITPAAQRRMATRAGSKVVEVKSSHVAMMSAPVAVVDMIQEAAGAVL